MHHTAVAVGVAAVLAVGGTVGGLVATSDGPADSPPPVPVLVAASPRAAAPSRPAPGLSPVTPAPTATPTPAAPPPHPATVVRRTTAAAPATHAAAPAYPATLARVPASAAQAVTVTASGYGARTARLEAWTHAATGWVRTFGPWTANLGYTGLARPGAKHEGDGHTPSGVYGFSYLFGIEPNPGVHYSYRQVTGSYDVWDDDPASPRYNEWVDTRTADAGASPEPMDNAPSYRYGAVIGYNTARTPGLGSAIFLHVTKGGSTAGCVAIPEGDLVPLLRWLQPGTRISIGTG